MTRELATATPKRALHLALALAVASWEQSTTKDSWRRRGWHRDHATVLAALRGWGYDLSDIETRIVAATSQEVI